MTKQSGKLNNQRLLTTINKVKYVIAVTVQYTLYLIEILALSTYNSNSSSHLRLSVHMRISLRKNNFFLFQQYSYVEASLYIKLR